MVQIYPMVDNIQVRVQSHPYRMNTNNPLGNQNRFLYRMSENYRSHHSPVGFFEFKNFIEFMIATYCAIILKNVAFINAAKV